MRELRTEDSDFPRLWQRVCQRNAIDTGVDDTVAGILAEVEKEGAAAVLRWSARFDGTQFESLYDAILIPDATWLEGVTPRLRLALELAAARIRDFHTRQLPADFAYADEYGNRMGSRWTAVGKAGLYVPGGKAAYPSSVLMNAIPAKVAGVPELTMVTPPGFMKPEVKAAAWLAGVHRVVTVGGVQAIGLLAFGAEGVEPVDVIVGPGNRYVAAAKRLVYGRVAIDMIAGPSEILVLADGTVDPDWIAADLLSQAEHDEAAVCGVIGLDTDYLSAVRQKLQIRAAATPRSAIALAAIATAGFSVLAHDRAEMIRLANDYAPEHLELAVTEPQGWLQECTIAGSIFLGPWTPEAVGDYVSGPNHVLPTARTARFYSPLGVDTFMKRSGWMEWTVAGIEALGSTIIDLAEAEELNAHADSIRVRHK